MVQMRPMTSASEGDGSPLSGWILDLEFILGRTILYSRGQEMSAVKGWISDYPREAQ
jgi:hypothetical protein